MQTIINFLRRTLALYAVRCLEIELHDQTTALQHVGDAATQRAISSAREATQRALLAARQRYIARLAPGHCPTWRTA